MGRNKKIGLDYFPCDVDILQDIKIRRLIKYKGGQAALVYILLLCSIYHEGYYMTWNDDLPFIVSEMIGFDEDYIKEVVECCMNVGLFSSELFKNDGVLTSKGIQERYQKINNLCRRNTDIFEYSLISSEEINISSEEKRISSAKSTQRKEKESKVNKSKVNNKENSTNVESKKDELSLSHSSTNSIDFKAFMEYFNNRFEGKLPTIRTMSRERRAAVKARAAEYGKKAVFEVLEKVASSPFLLGHNDRNWTCDFNWIFKPNNFVKILEGSYDKSTNPDTAEGRKESVKNLAELAVAVLQGSATKID